MTNPELQIDIHVPSRKTEAPDYEHHDPGLSGYSRPEIAEALMERGAEATFSRGPSAYDHAAGVAHVLLPRLVRNGNQYDVYVTPQDVHITSINAVRTTTAPLENDMNELNRPKMRSTVGDRWVSGAILRLAGDPTDRQPLIPGMGVGSALSRVNSDLIVVKPRIGSKGGFHYGTKAEIAEQFTSGQLSPAGEWQIETWHDTMLPVPVSGEDETQQDRIAAANAGGHGVLRSYLFGEGQDGTLAASHVMRLTRPGAKPSPEDFAFINQSTVPEDIVTMNPKIANVLGAHALVKEAHLAIDWGRVKVGGHDAYVPLAVYAAEPLLVPTAQNAEVAQQQAGMLADQLIRVARMDEIVSP